MEVLQNCSAFFSQFVCWEKKDQIILPTGRGILADRFLGSTWNRKLKFSAYAWFIIFWAHLDNFYFHFFIQNPCTDLSIVFLNFSLWSPLWNNENKSCLNELKFWEASENHKSSICWKFQLSILCGTQKSAKIPQPVAKMIWSFWCLKWLFKCLEPKLLQIENFETPLCIEMLWKTLVSDTTTYHGCFKGSWRLLSLLWT